MENQTSPLSVKKGQIAEIEIQTGREEVEAYFTTIDMIVDDILGLSLPQKNGSYLQLKNGTQIKIILFLDGQGYKYPSTILNCFEVPVPMCLVKKPVDSFVVEKRAWVRISVNMGVHYSLLNQTSSKMTLGQIMNISAGGILLVTSDRLMVGEKLRITLNLDNYGVIEVLGNVVRVIPKQIGDEQKYFSGIDFFDIDELKRNLLHEWIFEHIRNEVTSPA